MIITVSRRQFGRTAFVLACSVIVFARFLNAGSGFSYDYQAYLFIIDKISALSFSDIWNLKFKFPYVEVPGIVPIEPGFALLVRALGLVITNPSVAFAILAAASVGARLYVMETLGVPRFWNVFLNIIAITLFEANAIRLGIAISLLLIAMVFLLKNRRAMGLAMVVFAISVHLQLVIFVVPFAVFYVFSTWITRTRVRLVAVIAAFGVTGAFIPQLFPLIGNVKLDEYITRGYAQVTGISVTSVLAVLLISYSALLLRQTDVSLRVSKFWAAILAASVPSVVMLLSLTNVAVVGDRAWQVAFMIWSAFFFTNWATKAQKRGLFLLFAVVSAVIFINIVIRFPLSNLMAPPFPGIASPIAF